MTDKPNNPQAFPTSAINPGMTLRDYFAGQALGGYFAAEDGPLPSGVTLEQHHNDVCKAIYGYADAMLLARTKAPHHDG